MRACVRALVAIINPPPPCAPISSLGSFFLFTFLLFYSDLRYAKIAFGKTSRRASDRDRDVYANSRDISNAFARTICYFVGGGDLGESRNPSSDVFVSIYRNLIATFPRARTTVHSRRATSTVYDFFNLTSGQLYYEFIPKRFRSESD